jgi:hypothetical protein
LETGIHFLINLLWPYPNRNLRDDHKFLIIFSRAEEISRVNRIWARWWRNLVASGTHTAPRSIVLHWLHC